MAHLMPFRSSGRSRAQMFLIGAIALAISFVALTVLLNTAIYTENIASRGENVGGTDVHRFISEVTDHAETTMMKTDAGTSSETAIESDINGSNGWGALVTQQYASQGLLVGVEMTDSTSGTRLNHDDPSETFVSGDIVSTNSNDHVRDVRLSLDPDEMSGASDEFQITIDDESDPVTVEYEAISFFEFEIRADTDNDGIMEESCTRESQSDGFVDVDMTRGTANGSPCSALDGIFPDSSYTIEFNDTNDTAGTWTMTVTDSAPTTNALSDSRVNSPSFPYSIDVEVSYQDHRDTYSDTLTVKPGEP